MKEQVDTQTDQPRKCEVLCRLPRENDKGKGAQVLLTERKNTWLLFIVYGVNNGTEIVIHQYPLKYVSATYPFP